MDRWFSLVLYGHSRCGSCQKQLAWYHLIPVFSWFICRGRCSCCQAKISPLYPLIETALGLAFMWLTFYQSSVHLFILTVLCLWIAWMDWYYLQIPALGLLFLASFGLMGDPETIPVLVLSVTALLCWRLQYCHSGDVYLLVVCSLWVPTLCLPLFCSVAGLLIFIFGVKYRKATCPHFPLAPPLLLSLWFVRAYIG